MVRVRRSICALCAPTRDAERSVTVQHAILLGCRLTVGMIKQKCERASRNKPAVTEDAPKALGAKKNFTEREGIGAAAQM